MSLELNKIYNMDCLEGLKLIEDNSIDLIVTDSPYQFDIATVKNSNGGGFYKHQKKKYIQDIEESFGLNFNPEIILKEYQRICKLFNCYIWTNKHLLINYLEFAKKNNYHFELLIWKKTNPVPVFNGHYLFDKEYCLYIAEKGRYFNSKLGIKPYYTVKEFPIGIKVTTHPTEKPIDFIRQIIEISSKEGDKVLDAFMGSGTTAVAAKQLNRNFIGFEISKEYCDMANKRLEQDNLKNWF